MNTVVLKSSISNDTNSDSGNINELVKRWNHSAKVGRTCDRKNYINGYIKFLYEYAGIRNLSSSSLLSIHGLDVPSYVPIVLAEAAIDNSSGKIWDLFDNHIRRKPCVIS
ncbi:MAG: hypothetical protein ACKVOA_08565, partial [Methylophilaceae bacterium]